MATEVIAAYMIHPSTAEERLMAAAEDGNIDTLYDVIREKPELLRPEDFHSFSDTPLHRATACKQIKMVKELIALQPQMAKKLNQDGLSPMHIALKEGHIGIVWYLLEFDQDLVRVKGKNGHTPLHYMFIEGRKLENVVRVLNKFLKKCPECIHDTTNENDNAFHLAAKSKNYKAFGYLMTWLYSSDNTVKKIKKILNAQNSDGDTVLHIAAFNNQEEILKFATNYAIIDLEATNSRKLTALRIAESKNSENCAGILRRANYWYIFMSPGRYVFEVKSRLADIVHSMPNDSSNALLVVATLILTATYQSALSPPGGVYQLSTENTTSTSPRFHSTSHTSESALSAFFQKSEKEAGSSVLKTSRFLCFFIPNVAAFCLSFLVICFILISILPPLFSAPLVTSLSALLYCLLVSAVIIISPNTRSLDIMFQYVYLFIYALSLVVSVITVVHIQKIIKKIYYQKYAKNGRKF